MLRWLRLALPHYLGAGTDRLLPLNASDATAHGPSGRPERSQGYGLGWTPFRFPAAILRLEPTSRPSLGLGALWWRLTVDPSPTSLQGLCAFGNIA